MAILSTTKIMSGDDAKQQQVGGEYLCSGVKLSTKMSRIGKMPVHFEKDVQVTVGGANIVTVKGPKVSLSYKLNPAIKPKVEPGVLTLSRASEEKKVKALHGLYRALIRNAVQGVTKGFTKNLDINGVGYKANVAGRKLELNLGYTLTKLILISLKELKLKSKKIRA